MRRRNFFSLSNYLYEFFLGRSMNISGLIGLHEFSFISFSLARIFFLYFARLPPISFLMVCPLYSILHSPIQLSIQQFQPSIQHSTLIFTTFNYSLDCLQSTFSLKIRLVLDFIPRDCKPRCYYIGIETRREKTDC